MPNILLLSSADVNNSSGVIAYDLHLELSSYFKSTLVIKETKTQNDSVISYVDKVNENTLVYKFFRKVESKVYSKLLLRNNDYHFRPTKKTLLNSSKLLKMVEKPDVIITLFMQSFFSYKTLLELQEVTGAPIISIFPDMEYLTGGCHYAWDCKGYLSNCDSCPAILNSFQKKIAKNRLAERINFVDDLNIWPVACSEQLFLQTKQSKIYNNKKTHKILLGIDQKVFWKQSDINLLKKKYNLNLSKFTILFGAVNNTEKRKGKIYLDQVLEKFSTLVTSNNDVQLITIGGNFISENLNISVINLGYIDDIGSLAEIYNIADVFLVPSIQDSGPSMINQSLLCGTPVVSFEIGVSKDLIVNGFTGYRVPLYDTNALANGLFYFYKLNPEERCYNSKRCAEFAINKTSLKVQARKISELINKALEMKI